MAKLNQTIIAAVHCKTAASLALWARQKCQNRRDNHHRHHAGIRPGLGDGDETVAAGVHRQNCYNHHDQRQERHRQILDMGCRETHHHHHRQIPKILSFKSSKKFRKIQKKFEPDSNHRGGAGSVDSAHSAWQLYT